LRMLEKLSNRNGKGSFLRKHGAAKTRKQTETDCGQCMLSAVFFACVAKGVLAEKQLIPAPID